MKPEEQALTFDCEGDTLIGLLSGVSSPARRGVLIVVGGPQYRAGSHRQFTLLARHLAAHGIPALRFDYRGMGDSTGVLRSFERVAADLHCAIDRFFDGVPGLKEVVIWGLCDAASAALCYAHLDPRVSGLVLLNPWVHTERGTAQAYLRHYYVSRLFQSSLWQKIGRGEFSLRRAAAGFAKLVVEAIGYGQAKGEVGGRGAATAAPPADHAALPERMAEGLRLFKGRVLLILSGNDLIASEFRDLIAGSRDWRRLIEASRVTRRELPQANHTFARREWRDQVARWTQAWVAGS